MELTSKQQRHLRGLGQRLTAAIAIGRGGLSEEAAAHLDEALSRHELVKIRLPAGPQRKVLPAEAAEALDAMCVGLVGRTALLYRPNPKLDAQHRVNLPK